MKRVLVLFVVIVLTTIFISGCVGNNERLKEMSTPTILPTSIVTTVTPIPTPTFLSTRIELSGIGSDTKSFKIDRGIWILKTSLDEKYEFFEIESADSGMTKQVIGRNGPFDGSTMIELISTGNYTFKTNMLGSWRAIIEPPTVSPNSILQFSGSKQKATELFPLSGSKTFNVVHYGDENFDIRLFDSSGNFATNVDNYGSIARGIGNYNSSKVVNVDAGYYLLNIYSQGSWKVTIE